MLDQGEIAEFDKPQTLLQNPESRFAKLAATQGIHATKDGKIVIEEDQQAVQDDSEASGQ